MSNPLQPDAELNTWQEIAAYLGVSKREAQYWEQNDGMPVHRMPGKKSRVKAYPAELDAWKSQVMVNRINAGAVPLADVGKGLPHEGEADASATTARPTNRQFSRRALVGGLAGAAAASAVGASLIFRQHAEPPMRAAVVGNTLSAWDADGRLLWRYLFPDGLRAARSGSGPRHDPFSGPPGADCRLIRRRSKVCPLRCLLRAGTEPTAPRGALPLLAYRQARLAVRPGRYGCFFRCDVLAPMAPERHDRRPRFPSKCCLVGPFTLDVAAGGRPCVGPRRTREVKFVSAGQLYALCRVPSGDGRHYLVAGGVNYEYAAASLAVLDEDAPPSCSPQTPGSRFECVGGPKGSPERYFLLPPTELSVASDQPYNFVVQVRRIDNKYVVDTTDIPGERVGAIYQFSDRMEPLDVAFGDGWAARHRRLQEEGRLKHGIRECPLLVNATQVRRWDSKLGWTTVNVPQREREAGCVSGVRSPVARDNVENVSSSGQDAVLRSDRKCSRMNATV